jgi:hypothetical protein
MKRLIVFLILLTVAAFGAGAQSRGGVQTDNAFASDFQTVPVMGNTPGAGATFQTFVALLNPTSAPFNVEANLYDQFGNKRTATITLAAGEQKTYANFLQSVFNYTGGGAVTFRSDDPSKRFIVNSEVWTTGSRYGTSIPSLEFAGSNSRSFAAGVTVDGTTRTNIGCFNQSASENVVRATVMSKTGQTAGTVELKLPGNAWAQTAVNNQITDGYVVFDPSEAAVCYAVVITNSTNDGRFITATEYRP